MSSIARIDRAIDVRRLACVWGVRACSSLVTIRRESLSLCARVFKRHRSSERPRGVRVRVVRV